MPEAIEKVRIIFRRIAEVLESLPEDELSRLADPSCALEIRAVRRKAKDAPTVPALGAEIDEIIKEITSLATRTDAQELLAARYPARKTLEQIARHLDIPIAKQDKADSLRDKIVEATVGARIRSQTIQGTGT